MVKGGVLSALLGVEMVDMLYRSSESYGVWEV